MTATDTSNYPMLRVYACLDAYDDANEQYEALKHDRTEAKKAVDDSEEAMREAIRELRDSDSDEAKARASGTLEDVERREEQHHAIDRKARSQGKTVDKLMDRMIYLLREARDPNLDFDGVEFDADAWKMVELRDIMGHEADENGSPSYYPTRVFEGHAVRTIGQYLTARAGKIAELVMAEEIDADQVARFDAAVYRYLSRRDLEGEWPIEPPAGGQLRIQDAGVDEADG